MPTQAEADAATAQFIADQGLFHTVVKGGVNATIQDDDGNPVKSLAGVIAGIANTNVGDAAAAVLNKRAADPVFEALDAKRNLFDKSRSSPNAAIGGGGQLVAPSNGYFATPFIRVAGVGSIVANVEIFGGNGNVYGVAFYDAGKAFLSATNTGDVTPAGTPIAVPDNAIFARFACTTDKLRSLYLVYGNVAPVGYRAFRFMDQVSDRGSAMDAISDADRGRQVNLFDPDRVAAGYLNLNDGTITPGGYITSDFMPVQGGRQYITTHYQNDGTGYAWFDIDKTFISGVAHFAANTPLTAPSGASYLRMTFYGGYGNSTFRTIMVCEGATLPSTYRAAGLVDPDTVVKRASARARDYGPIGLNMFDRRNVFTGDNGLLGANGTFSNGGQNYFATDFLPVTPGGIVCFNADFVPGNAGYGVNWYDRNRNRIGSVSGGFTGTTVNGSAVINISAFNGPPQASSPVKGAPVTGAGIPADAYFVDGPFGQPGNYTISVAATASAANVSLSMGGYLAGVPISVPEGAHYCRTSGDIGGAQLRYFAVTDRAAIPIISQTSRVVNSAIPIIGFSDFVDRQWMAGKNLATGGDSIMQSSATGGAPVAGPEGVMQRHLRESLHANLVYAGGISGRQLRQVLDGVQAGLPGNHGAWVPGDAAAWDLWICNAVTNDWGARTTSAVNNYYNQRPLGDINDASNAGTFCGDFKRIYVEQLLPSNPRCRFAHIGPLRRFDDYDATTNPLPSGDPINNQNVRLSAYNDALKQLCYRWGVAYFDAFNLVGLNTFNRGIYTIDDLHPNPLGVSELIGPQYIKFIESLR